MAKKAENNGFPPLRRPKFHKLQQVFEFGGAHAFTFLIAFFNEVKWQQAEEPSLEPPVA